MNGLMTKVADSAAAIDADEKVGVERHTNAIKAAKDSAARLKEVGEAVVGHFGALSAAGSVPLSTFDRSRFPQLAALPAIMAALELALTQGAQALGERVQDAKDDLNAFLAGIASRRAAHQELEQALTSRDAEDLDRFVKMLERTDMQVTQKKVGR